MKKKSLRFNKDGTFKIMVATDIHENYFGNDKERNAKTEDCLNLLDASVKALNPDLVIFDGDSAFGDTPEQVHEVIEKITKSIQERDIPLAVVMGNHEHDDNRVDPKLVMKMFCEYKNCLMRDDDPTITGVGNYYILIKGKGNKIKYNLWFIDSNQDYKRQKKNCDFTNYDCVHDDQIEWYEKVSAELAQQNDGEPVPALLFQHMPVPEEYQLLREAKPAENAVAVKGHHIFSSKNYVLKSGVEGQYNEPICSPCYNNGQFDSWKKMGDVRGAFFGHDHKNDFAGYVDGIMLAQCRGTGFNGYSDGDRTGVRLIVLNENDLSTFETKTYYFRDFGLTSKSVSLLDSKLTDKQKSTIAKATKIGVGVAAACAATAVAVSKIKKKKDE